MVLRRFLLSQCTEDEEDRVLRAVFDDPEVAERLETVEFRLADAYVLGELTQLEREGFEQRLARNPASREAVTLSQALIGRFGKKKSYAPWWFAAAAAFALAILFPLTREKPTPVLETQQPMPKVEARVVIWELSPGLTRSTQAARNRFEHPGADAILEVRIRAAKPDRFESRIETVEGKVLWRGISEPVTTSSELISFRVPASLVPRNDLILFVDTLPATPFFVE
jgi:anti-sigma factor RsiW